MGVAIDRVEAEVVEPPAPPLQPQQAGSGPPTPTPADIELILKRLAAREARLRAE